MGSTEAARRAGRKQATRAVARRTAPTNEGGEVQCVNAEQQALHGAPDEVGADETERQADGGKDDAVANDESHDAVPGGAESHTESDLVRTLGHGKRHDSVDTERGQE